MLLRRFIGKRLAAYYAQSADVVVGGLSPQPLSSLWGKWHWIRLHKRLYQETKGQWLTPVELFQPYYSQTIANYIVECCNDTTSTAQSMTQQEGAIDIVEFGGGRGTNARHIMDHLQQIRPDLYERVSYKIIDASPSLHALQRRVLKGTSHADQGKYRFVHKDLVDAADDRVTLLPPSENLTILVALEVLDNLPHDKIRVRGRHIDQAIVRQTTTATDHRYLMEEVFVPLNDPLLERVLYLCPAFQEEARFAWVPTVICGVVDQIQQNRPNLQMLLADFDWLPPPDKVEDRPMSQRAVGEPLVTTMEDVDHACYVAGQSQLCDILFPTDFVKLADFVEQCCVEGSNGNNTIVPHVQKQKDFLQTYGPEQVAATKSWLTGFTPLLGDFGNCAVLTTRSDT